MSLAFMPHITLYGQSYRLHCLSSLEVLQAISLEKALQESLMTEDGNEELVHAMAEHAVLCYFCLWQEDAPAFASPMEVLKGLRIEELAQVYAQYQAMFMTKDPFGGSGEEAAECSCSKRP